MTFTRRKLLELLQIVSSTEPDELDCDEVLHRVGALLESLEAGTEPPRELAAVAQHLEVCGECREEFEALMRVYDAG